MNYLRYDNIVLYQHAEHLWHNLHSKHELLWMLQDVFEGKRIYHGLKDDILARIVIIKNEIMTLLTEFDGILKLLDISYQYTYTKDPHLPWRSRRG